VLSIRSVDPTEAMPDDVDMTPKEWLAFCRERGLVAFAAEREEEFVGYVAAESDAQAVHVVLLEGDTETCRVLLDRLVMLAGERDMSGWVPADRRDVRRIVRRLGFVRMAAAEIEDRLSYFYYWCRNDDV
jgi:hypothetical protein